MSIKLRFREFAMNFGLYVDMFPMPPKTLKDRDL